MDKFIASNQQFEFFNILFISNTTLESQCNNLPDIIFIAWILLKYPIVSSNIPPDTTNKFLELTSTSSKIQKMTLFYQQKILWKLNKGSIYFT